LPLAQSFLAGEKTACGRGYLTEKRKEMAKIPTLSTTENKRKLYTYFRLNVLGGCGIGSSIFFSTASTAFSTTLYIFYKMYKVDRKCLSTLSLVYLALSINGVSI
jgi:hypothetical protein